MPVELKGKKILKDIDYERIRESLIESIIEKISKEGTQGYDLRLIIEEILKEDKFKEFIGKLVEQIQKRTEMNEKESKISASYLIQEDIGDEIIKNIKEVEKEEIGNQQEKKVSEKGEKEGLWKKAKKISLGRKYNFFKELLRILKRHFVLKLTIITGIVFLITSSILFHSVYKAVLVGLTLTAFPDERLYIKIANLLGGIGGILIFFTSLSIVLQHFLVVRSRDELLRELARKFLESKSIESKNSPY